MAGLVAKLIEKKNVDVKRFPNIKDAYLYAYEILPGCDINCHTVQYIISDLFREIGSNTYRKIIVVNVKRPFVSTYIKYDKLDKNHQLYTSWSNLQKGDFIILVLDGEKSFSMLSNISSYDDWQENEDIINARIK